MFTNIFLCSKLSRNREVKGSPTQEEWIDYWLDELALSQEESSRFYRIEEMLVELYLDREEVERPDQQDRDRMRRLIDYDKEMEKENANLNKRAR